MEASLKVSNPKILNFYKKHDFLDFETMNILFVNILEQITENITIDKKNIEQSEIMKHVLEKMNHIESQNQLLHVEVESMRNNQTNFTHTINNIQSTMSDINTHFFSLLETNRDKYIEDIKNLIEKQNSRDTIESVVQQSNNYLMENTIQTLQELFPQVYTQIKSQIIDAHNNIKSETLSMINNIKTQDLEKVQQTFQETIHEKYDAFYTNLFQLLSQNNDTLFSKINESNNSVSQISEFIEKQKHNNSSVKGKEGECKLDKILNNLYPNACVTNTTSNAKCGDFLLERIISPDGAKKSKIMIENKEYVSNVNNDEVKKFLRDIDYIKTHGVFLSQYSGIANKNNFEINLHNGNILVYVHHVNYDPNIVNIAIQIIDQLSQKVEEYNFDGASINNETLVQVNQEMLTFFDKKNRLLSIIKDLQREIDGLEIPTLSLYLKNKFSNTEYTQFVCPHCESSFKNNRGLASHMKGCKGKGMKTIDIVTSFAKSEKQNA